MTVVRSPESLKPGDVVGSWRIEGYAGRGSYGMVFRARRIDAPRSPPVALKMAAFAYDLRFLREGEVLSRFRHPSIPQLLYRDWWIAGPQAAHPYLILEWIRGQSLYQWARVHRPTARQVLQVLGQLAGALDVLHQGGCLHRDVKGDNILIEPTGRAVLMDYGSSTWAGAPPLTETLMPPNTPEYRSPEALRFQWANWQSKEARYEARPADDLYALGVSAYQLVTHVYPPPGTEPEELKQRMGTPPPTRLPPQTLNERVVPELAVLIERMLEKEPEARGLASDASHAAEAAAANSRPALDVPLWDTKHSQDDFACARVRLAPISESEGPSAESAPRSAPAEPPTSSSTLRPRLMFVVMVLALVGIWWMGPTSRKQMPERVQGASLEAKEAPDSGATGLGDGGVTARVESQEEPSLAKTVAKQMPKNPFPDQRRAPCGRGEVELRGGCWAPGITLTPPCGDAAYEWNGVCYWPLLKETQRVPTSKKPQ
jgi:serine/threonine protein kinase